MGVVRFGSFSLFDVLQGTIHTGSVRCACVQENSRGRGLFSLSIHIYWAHVTPWRMLSVIFVNADDSFPFVELTVNRPSIV